MTNEEIKQELTGKEWQRFQKIKWRRSGDQKKYFHTFDTRLEAFRFLQKVARRYAHSDKYTNKIKDLCEEYQEQGIMIYAHTLGRWLHDVFDLDIHFGHSKNPNRRISVTITMDDEVYDLYKQLKRHSSVFNRSDYLNILYRHHWGLEIDELIVYFGEDEDAPISVVFYEGENGEVGAIYGGYLDTSTRKLIESLCTDAEQVGLDYVKNKCRTLGYFAFGLNSNN